MKKSTKLVLGTNSLILTTGLILPAVVSCSNQNNKEQMTGEQDRDRKSVV